MEQTTLQSQIARPNANPLVIAKKPCPQPALGLPAIQANERAGASGQSHEARRVTEIWNLRVFHVVPAIFIRTLRQRSHSRICILYWHELELPSPNFEAATPVLRQISLRCT
jgi:hypothetical protein